jgi:hypothetical protein
MVDKWSDDEIAYIINLKDTSDLTWEEVTEKYNKKFRKEKNFENLKKCYQRYLNYFDNPDNHIRTLKNIHRTKKTNSYTAKENKTILDQWVERDDLIETIENTVKKMTLQKFAVPKKVAKSKAKKNMTLELLFSDVHYGKYIDNIEGNYVDSKVIRERVKKIADSVIKEIAREGKSFNVEKVILALMGDVIENADFHGQESEKGCEFSTSRQVQEAITSMFYDLILPIAMTGVEIFIPCVTGNHDRIGHNKTYQKPGEDNLTFIVYSTLELLCIQSNLKNVKFAITKGLYTVVQVYGNNIVYEHGDELKNINRETMANQMSRRQVQIGKIVHFYRVGHWHEPVQYGQGRMMVNGSVPGQDDYAESKGFRSEAVQIMNYYVQTEKRNTCFFRSFPIYLQKK